MSAQPGLASTSVESPEVIRFFLSWFPMIPIAVANGALREAWLVPRTGEHRARQLSTLLLIAFFSIYFAVVFSVWPIASRTEAVNVGSMWLALTLVFEFVLGRFVSRLSWRKMLSEYNLVAGRLWALVPLWVAAAPYVFFRLQR